MNRRHYKVSARHWFTMDLVHLEYDGKNAKFNGSRYIYAPAEYSYRCESVSTSRSPQLSPHSDKDNANDWQISFDDFQVGSETMKPKTTTLLRSHGLKSTVNIFYIKLNIVLLCSA